MSVRYQLVIDCADPDAQARFWAAALAYELAPPPAGFGTWDDYYRDLGLPEEALTGGADRISDPLGGGPAIWFHVVEDAKVVKNRLHLDVHASGDRGDPIETRKKRVDAEADRLVGLGATRTCVMFQEGVDHYAVGMMDLDTVRAHYVQALSTNEAIHAICDDCRASAFTDAAHDEADRAAGTKLTQPTLAMWQDPGDQQLPFDPEKIWASWAPNLRTQALNSGHFLPEERPAEVARAIEDLVA